MLNKSIVAVKGCTSLRKTIKNKVKRHGNKKVRAQGKKAVSEE